MLTLRWSINHLCSALQDHCGHGSLFSTHPSWPTCVQCVQAAICSTGACRGREGQHSTGYAKTGTNRCALEGSSAGLAWYTAQTTAKPHTCTHQNPRQHIPHSNTTAERLCYDISNQEQRQATGYGRSKGTMEKRKEKLTEVGDVSEHRGMDLADPRISQHWEPYFFSLNCREVFLINNQEDRSYEKLFSTK